MRGLFVATVIALSSIASAQEPSLEDMEGLSGEMNSVPAKDAEKASPAKAGIESSKAAAETPTAEAVEPAAKGDVSGFAPIDIQSRIQKVMEPNLFAGAPVMPGTIRGLAVGEAPEDYEVQEGDNLYDICDQLIDEAGYWPKLWAFNPSIVNPHFVYPGTRLRFFSGDAETPPFLQVVTEDDILPVEKGKIVESELVREDINGLLMRNEATATTPIVDAKDIVMPPDIEKNFWFVGGPYQIETLQVIIPAFIVEEEMEELGEVVGGSAGSFLVDKGQDVIVRDIEGLKVGGNYSVVRPSGDIENKDGDDIGIRYEFIAQMRVELPDKDDESLFRGKAVFNRLGIQPGDKLVAYRSVKRSIPAKRGSASKASNQQIVGFTHPDTEIGGRGDFIFIDQKEGKLNAGSTYMVLQNVRIASPSFLRDEIPDSDSRVAWIYVIDSSQAAATAYIINDAFEVRLGDRLAP